MTAAPASLQEGLPGHRFDAGVLTGLLAAGVPQRFLRTLLQTFASPSEWLASPPLAGEDVRWRVVAPVAPPCPTEILGTPTYPWPFAVLDAPPVLLYVDGDPALVGPCVCVTGSRIFGELSRGVVSVVASAVVSLDAVLVSGGDPGVEEHAVRAVLDRGGKVLLVPACAPDAASDRLRALCAHVRSGGGTVVSQFPPFTRESFHTSRARLRLLAALAYPLVVADATLPSAATVLAGEALTVDAPLLVPYPPRRFRDDPAARGLRALVSLESVDELGWSPAISSRAGVNGFANGVPENGEELREMLRIFWCLRPRTPADLRRRAPRSRA